MSDLVSPAATAEQFPTEDLQAILDMFRSGQYDIPKLILSALRIAGWLFSVLSGPKVVGDSATESASIEDEATALDVLSCAVTPISSTTPAEAAAEEAAVATAAKAFPAPLLILAAIRFLLKTQSAKIEEVLATIPEPLRTMLRTLLLG